MEGQQVGIKTASIEEKCRAFEMLVVHCSTMGVKFAPWLPQVLQLVIPGLSFIFHDGVREAAALYVVRDRIQNSKPWEGTDYVIMQVNPDATRLWQKKRDATSRNARFHFHAIGYDNRE